MNRKLVRAGAVCLAGALALTACGGDDDGGSGSSDGPITIYNTKPENPLVPANTNEEGGSNIVQAVFRGLVEYNPDTAAPEMSMAESIESEDQITWTITLKEGNTFQDGSPVNAKSFVDAWNWAAYGPNAALNNYFYAPFEGYEAINPVDPDEDGPKEAPKPKTDTLSGLEATGELTFTAKMSAPLAVFPTMVGYNAFAPLPPAFFEDEEAFGKKPIGNGPFQMTEGDADSGFTLKKWADYKGPDPAKVDEIQYKTYATDTAGYADLLAGNLDFMDQVPASALVDNQYQQDLPGRSNNVEVGVIGTASLPTYDDNYDDPNVGKALSLAIDRDNITKSVYNGGRTPATGWVSPAVEGYKAGACGEFCTYDPAKAKEYLAKADFKGPFEFATNTDGPGNKEAGEAICNSIKNALGVECTVKGYADFGTFRTDINGDKMKQFFRTSWQMDYPSIQNFLEPLYVTGASANDGRYSNKEFDDLIKQANQSEGDEANALYQQAEALLAQDMSVVPLWYQAQQSGWSERLGTVKITPLSNLSLTDLTLK